MPLHDIIPFVGEAGWRELLKAGVGWRLGEIAVRYVPLPCSHLLSARIFYCSRGDVIGQVIVT